MRKVLFAVVALTLTACGGSSPTAPQGPQYPQIGGTYSSGSFWSFQFTNVRTGQSFTAACPGSATLSQNNSQFSGSFLMNSTATCNASSGQIRSGQVATDGGVSFDLFVPGADPNALTALTGCVVASGDTLIRGSIQTGRLDASSSAVLWCGSETINVTMRLLGFR